GPVPAGRRRLPARGRAVTRLDPAGLPRGAAGTAAPAGRSGRAAARGGRVMAAPLPPWVRSLPFARRRRTALLLLTLGWTVCGIALWLGLGIRAWCVARGPPLVAEALLVDTATPAMGEALAR